MLEGKFMGCSLWRGKQFGLQRLRHGWEGHLKFPFLIQVWYEPRGRRVFAMFESTAGIFSRGPWSFHSYWCCYGRLGLPRKAFREGFAEPRREEKSGGDFMTQQIMQPLRAKIPSIWSEGHSDIDSVHMMPWECLRKGVPIALQCSRGWKVSKLRWGHVGLHGWVMWRSVKQYCYANPHT